MCGLVGLISKRETGFYYKDAEMLQQMLYADAVRGWDATGVFGVNKYGNVDIRKAATAASVFVTTKDFDDFKKDMVSKYRVVIGHNRKATHGEKNSGDAHPFWDKDENICLVHNGMISNYKSFCNEATVDSDAICTALSEKTPQEIFYAIEGAYAFIWYDVAQKKTFFIRNKDRPLYVSETDSSYILTSEHGLAHWIAGRNSEKITSTILIDEDVLYHIDLDDKKLVKEEKIEKKAPFFPIVVPIHTTTTQLTKVGTTAVTDTVDLDQAPHAFFLTDIDYPDQASVLRNIHRKDSILVSVDSYEETRNKLSMELICKLVNVNKTWIDIRMYLSKDLFRDLDITQLLRVNVLNIDNKKGYVLIYANNPVEEIGIDTVDGLTITETMWFDDRFPIECDVCKQQVKFHSLPHSSVVIADKSVIAFVCPSCLGGKHAY